MTTGRFEVITSVEQRQALERGREAADGGGGFEIWRRGPTLRPVQVVAACSIDMRESRIRLQLE